MVIVDKDNFRPRAVQLRGFRDSAAMPTSTHNKEIAFSVHNPDEPADRLNKTARLLPLKACQALAGSGTPAFKRNAVKTSGT